MMSAQIDCPGSVIGVAPRVTARRLGISIHVGELLEGYHALVQPHLSPTY